MVRQSPQGETLTEFRPFYSLRHGHSPEQSGHYWMMRRDEHISAVNPGYETEITIVDIDFDPAAVATHTLSIELTGTNRDFPSQLLYNQPGGDLKMGTSNDASDIRLLRKPTPTWRFARVGGVHWRLISHLSLNHLSLADGGLDSFREMLTLYDLPRSPSTQRQIGGIHAISYHTATIWLPGNPFPCLVRGLEVRMTIDEDAFVGVGIHAFAQVIDRFLGLYVHANSFTQLLVVSEKTGEILFKCPPPKRRFEPAVIARLFEDPQRFAYFQAVRLVDLWLKRHGTPADRARPRGALVAEYLRFQNSTSFAFPVNQIEAMHVEPATPGRAMQASTLTAVCLTPTFMGLLGGHGALPAHYTERIAAYLSSEKDAGPRAFFDTWSNRTLALFYEAWRKYRVELQYEVQGADHFLPLVLSLAGLGNAGLRQRLAHGADGRVRDESLAHVAATLQQRTVSSVQIARVLADYFDRPVRAEQFIGSWYGVPPEQQTALGGSNAVLGAGALAGDRVWQRNLRLRLVIGPLDHASLQTFLPGGVAARALHSLVTMLTGTALEYEVQLVLRAGDVKGATLGGATREETGTAGRLGWDSYLLSRPSPSERSDVRYLVSDL
jgi:type VI secretion system protein ImpH